MKMHRKCRNQKEVTVWPLERRHGTRGQNFSRHARRGRHNVFSHGRVVTLVAHDGRLRGHQVTRPSWAERGRRALQQSSGTSTRYVCACERKSSIFVSNAKRDVLPTLTIRHRPRAQAQEEGFDTPAAARDADRAFPPPVVTTPQFASTPAWVGTKRGSAPGVPTPLTWAAKSEWPGGMMTPRFEGAGTYNTPEGSWLTGPVPIFDPTRENAHGNADANAASNTARALPLTPMSTGRFRADAATAAASASDENQDAVAPGDGDSLANGSVSKPTPSPLPRRVAYSRSPKSVSRLSRVLASPARCTEHATSTTAEVASASKTKTPSTAKRSLDKTFAPAEENMHLVVDDDMESVDMNTPSPSRRSGRLDSPVGSRAGSGKPPADRAKAGTPRRTTSRSAGKGAASPAAKMQAHALVSLANLREEMEDKERVWGDALAEAEAELAGAKREASEARTELAEEKAKTPEKLRALAKDLLQAREKPGTPPRADETLSPVALGDAEKASLTSSPASPAGDGDGAANAALFLQAKTHSLDREVSRLTAQLTAAEVAHARALDVEARKAKARVDAAKEETAAAFAREKDLWAEVHKLRERSAETAVLSEPAERELKALRAELEQARGAHAEATRRAAAAEASLGAATDDAERFRLESDTLAESLAETTKRLEAVTQTSQASLREAKELEEKEEQKHSAELAQAEEALAEARAALEASTTAEARAAAEARADAEARFANEREAARKAAEDREKMEAKLESLIEAREKERKEHKRHLKQLETKLEDAERRVAVAEIASETRRAETELELELEKKKAEAAKSAIEARVASASASAKKSEGARAEAALRRAETAEADAERARVEIAGAAAKAATLAEAKARAETAAAAAAARAEAAEADAHAARATAESVRVAAAADREAADEAERALRAQKTDAAFQLAEAARELSEKERRDADAKAAGAEAQASAREARAELASARGDLASARAEAAASARDATTAAKARENAESKAREASASSAASLSELAALKSEHARVVAELAASRAAARGGEEAASRLSAVEATREAIACELESAASKESQLHAKVRNLEVELERARAAAAAARLEKEEAEAERDAAGRELETARAESLARFGGKRTSDRNRAFTAGSAPSTPVDVNRARRYRNETDRRPKRSVPATTGKGRTPREGRAARDEGGFFGDWSSSSSTASGSDDEFGSNGTNASDEELAATPAAVAGLVGLARARRSPSAAGRSPRSPRSPKNPSAPGSARRETAARERAWFLRAARRRRRAVSAAIAGFVVLFAFLVAAARGASGSPGACAGGAFGVLAAFADEWLSGTVRARFRGRCDGGFPTPS